MILFALLAAAQPADSCADQIKLDPARVVTSADEWHAKGGGALARQCAALAYVALGRWQEAATAFEQAAREAEKAGELAAPNLWVQAGNARLAAGQPGPAVTALDAALATALLTDPAKGEARLDRARAQVGLGDLKTARADLDQALKLVPQDPLAWLLSASLARRMNALERAQVDIAEAARLSPDDASVALEAGRIALATGATAAARVAFEGAVRNQPGTEAALAAQAELDRLKAPAQR